jgi:hypothetical protein
MQAIYMNRGLYTVLVDHILIVLDRYKGTDFKRPRQTPSELHMGLQSALRLAGVPMGDLVMNKAENRVEPTERLALVDKLAAVEPSAFSGDYDGCDVKLALGEHGDVWPDEYKEGK